MEDRRLSRSLLSGLLVLSCFPSEGDYLGIAEIARMLDMNTSTTHRYVTTLLAVGLLERDPATRKYRLAAQ
jgi:DNA-binding IclR family transcriptional regulator